MEGIVSVIITSYKGTAHLIRALESVEKQCYPFIEIIVVDDNDASSKERKETEVLMNEYLKRPLKFPVKYIKHPRNMNGATARNTGVANSVGTYIQLLDDDDVLFPEKVGKSVKCLEDSGSDGVITSVACCRGDKIVAISGAHNTINLKDKRAEIMVVPDFLGTGSNIFIKKEVYQSLNGFDTEFMRMQDLEFMMRFFRKYKCSLLDEILIIKADNDRKIVYTDYHKQNDFKQKFWQKYALDLKEAMSKKQYFDYFNVEYTHLFRIALMSKSRGDLQEAIKNLCKIRPLTRKEKCFVKMHSLYVFLHRSKYLVNIVRSFKHCTEKDCADIVSLPAQTRDYIISIIGEKDV